MAVLSERLSNPLKNHLLSGVCLRVTEKDSSRRQIIEEFLHYLFERKHTRWDNRTIVELRSQARFGWSGKSVLIAGSVSHAKLVCSIIFFAFCFPKWT